MRNEGTGVTASGSGDDAGGLRQRLRIVDWRGSWQELILRGCHERACASRVSGGFYPGLGGGRDPFVLASITFQI